jgi:hypothetical protein
MSSINTLIKFLLAALFASLTVATPVQLASHAQVTTPVQLASRSQVVNGWFYWYFGHGTERALVAPFTSKQCRKPTTSNLSSDLKRTNRITEPVDPRSHGAMWVSPGKAGETDPAQCWMNEYVELSVHGFPGRSTDSLAASRTALAAGRVSSCLRAASLRSMARWVRRRASGVTAATSALSTRTLPLRHRSHLRRMLLHR